MTWEEIRSKRELLLKDSDWTQLADAQVDKQEWATYRQALRDIPQTYANPNDVVWPTKPT